MPNDAGSITRMSSQNIAVFGVRSAPVRPGEYEWSQAIEKLGYDSFWLRDHPSRAPEDPFTFLAAIAASTRRIRLGTLVACVQFRHPVSGCAGRGRRRVRAGMNFTSARLSSGSATG